MTLIVQHWVNKLQEQGKGADNLVLITLGTGVGAGIIVDGKIYSGRGSAGEVGHMIIEKDGLQCDCGQCGCWEKYASVSALIEQIKSSSRETPEWYSCRMC